MHDLYFFIVWNENKWRQIEINECFGVGQRKKGLTILAFLLPVLYMLC